MSILTHPQWAKIRTYLRVEAYDRDTNANGDVRHRLEVAMPEDIPTRVWLKGIHTPCPRCGQPVKPVRERVSWTTWYYAVACALDDKPSCARSREAAAEYRAIIADLQAHPVVPVPVQPSLF